MKFKISLVVSLLIGIFIQTSLHGGKWDKYYKNKMYLPPRDLVVKVVDSLPFFRTALDLGCGVGNETAFLIVSGWNVWAIDSEPKAIEILNRRNDIITFDKLWTIVSKFEDLNWNSLPQFDLVCANYSLPFCNPDRFDDVWASIKMKINTHGMFAGHFFGINHQGFSDSEMKNMNFWTREQLLEIFGDFEIEYFNEIEKDGTSGTGMKCHTHTFEIIAQKRY
jgi:SAM-dependent methyltransferase